MIKTDEERMMNSVNKLSETLLLKVKNRENTFFLKQYLANFELNTLTSQLTNDGLKKAFWINMYNAYFLILRRENKIQKPEIYRNKLIQIAHHWFSLDDIEHGILRKYRYKYSLGYAPNIFTNNLIKELAVEKLDYRIHFALNCGAKSCPPIAFYAPEKINTQLNTVTQAFLENETEFMNSKVHISKLFQWFLGDFGGKSGIRKIYKAFLNLDISSHKLVFKPYNWEENLDNFI